MNIKLDYSLEVKVWKDANPELVPDVIKAIKQLKTHGDVSSDPLIFGALVILGALESKQAGTTALQTLEHD